MSFAFCISPSRLVRFLISLACLLYASPTLAQQTIQGRVINGTTNLPAPHQKVELLTLGEGMKTASEIESGSDGSFTFSAVENSQTPHLLLRVLYHGVNYNLSVASHEEMEKPVTLTIYEPTQRTEDIQVSMPVMLAQASANALLVQQQYLVVNETTPKKALVNPQGTFFFDTPPEVTDELNVVVVGLAGIPLPQTPTPKSGGGYFISYPMKPGVNEVRVSYRVNFNSSQRELKHRLFYGTSTARVLILPADLQVSGDGVQSAGKDSRTQAALYQVKRIRKGEFLDIKIIGEAPKVSESDDASRDSESSEPQMQVVRLPNPVFEKKEIILGAFGVFFVLTILYALRQRTRHTNKTGASRKGIHGPQA